MKCTLPLLLLFGFPLFLTAQSTAEKTPEPLKISGSIGLTNNGISIIPTFSLNAPSTVFNFFIKKGRFSFDPDIRLTLDARKGSMLFWFRYKAIQKQKFSLTTGIHPAYNLQTRSITENGKTTNITQARRFIAFEAAPYYQVTPHFGFGPYILRGIGLQKDGPMSSYFLALNASLSNLPVTKKLLFSITPQFFYLKLDKKEGIYLATHTRLWIKDKPFALQSTINKEFKSNITGSKKLTWNITLSYSFSHSYQRKP